MRIAGENPYATRLSGGRQAPLKVADPSLHHDHAVAQIPNGVVGLFMPARLFNQKFKCGCNRAFRPAKGPVNSFDLFVKGSDVRCERLGGAVQFACEGLLQGLKPDVNTGKPDIYRVKPSVDAREPGVYRVKPSVDAREPGVYQVKPCVDAREPGVYRVKPCVDAREPGVYRVKPCVDAREPGVYQVKPCVDAREPGVYQVKPCVDAREPGVYQVKPCVDAREPGVYPVKPGINAGKPGFRGCKPRVGGIVQPGLHPGKKFSQFLIHIRYQLLRYKIPPAGALRFGAARP
jgi:hypothetical protein